MKLKKIIPMLLAALFLLNICSVGAFGGYADIVKDLGAAELNFVDGIGPETKECVLDYKYFSPVKNNDTTKYPLVIWLQGQGDNESPGAQLGGSDIVAWATDEMQHRFKDAQGAFIFVPRAPGDGWKKDFVEPLKATLDDFIEKNKNNIELTRIYLGGYSLGGWMSFNIAALYPEMFAAIFVACPALRLTKDVAEGIADIPIWITSGKNDIAVNYYTRVKPTWNKILSNTNIPEQCRLSTLSKATYPDGNLTGYGHSSWYAINYDMFSSQDGDYPRMSTIDGRGNTVKLTYPDGMISWLSEFKSNYDGSGGTGSENAEDENTTIADFFKNIMRYIKNFFAKLFI